MRGRICDVQCPTSGWKGRPKWAASKDISLSAPLTGTNAGALDRLRNAMLDPDESKRPLLESVLMSSFLGEGVESYTEQDAQSLMSAVAPYHKVTGRQIGKAELKRRHPAANASRKDRDNFAVIEQQNLAKLAACEAQLDAINADPKIKPFADAAKAASAAFQ